MNTTSTTVAKSERDYIGLFALAMLLAPPPAGAE